MKFANKIQIHVPILVLFLLCIIIIPAKAEGDPPLGELPTPVPQGIGGPNMMPNAQGTLEPVFSDDEIDELIPEEEDEDGNVFTRWVGTVVKNVVQITFPYDSLKDSTLSTFNSTFQDILGDEYGIPYDENYGNQESFGDSLDAILITALSDVYYENADSDGEESMNVMSDLRKDAWDVMFNLSLVLLPLVLVFNIMITIQQFNFSPAGKAEAMETISKSIISVVVAGSSFFLIDHLIRISTLASFGVLNAITSVGSLKTFITKLLLLGGGSIITTAGTAAIGATALLAVALVINVVIILSIIYLVGSILVMSFSKFTILMILTALAPLIYLLGTIPAFRWLQGLYTKMLVISLLLPIANSLLMGMTIEMVSKISIKGNIAGIIFSVFVSAALASILISLNAIVIKGVYGAFANIIDKAKNGVMTAVAAVGGGLMGGGLQGLAGAMGGLKSGLGGGGGRGLPTGNVSGKVNAKLAKSSSGQPPKSLPSGLQKSGKRLLTAGQVAKGSFAPGMSSITSGLRQINSANGTSTGFSPVLNNSMNRMNSKLQNGKTVSRKDTKGHFDHYKNSIHQAHGFNYGDSKYQDYILQKYPESIHGGNWEKAAEADLVSHLGNHSFENAPSIHQFGSELLQNEMRPMSDRLRDLAIDLYNNQLNDGERADISVGEMANAVTSAYARNSWASYQQISDYFTSGNDGIKNAVQKINSKDDSFDIRIPVDRNR